ncbi:hypothetical protein BU17DRAFT_79208 [Hysterangium stoloniferum]|nr:hypothetical protein BU17DRAFT_79208 [Hysterangium stoloniferum]
MPEMARKGTSQSVIDFARPITPLVTLELELAKSGMHPHCYTNTYTLTKPHLVICRIGPNAFFVPPIPVEHEPSAQETPFAATECLHGLSTPIRSNELSPITANYDEILMSSSGVKRLGKAPPPETPRKAVSVDELGALSAAQESTARKDDGNHTIKLMRRAFKAITGGTVSRRLSKAV